MKLIIQRGKQRYRHCAVSHVYRNTAYEPHINALVSCNDKIREGETIFLILLTNKGFMLFRGKALRDYPTTIVSVNKVYKKSFITNAIIKLCLILKRREFVTDNFESMFTPSNRDC